MAQSNITVIENLRREVATLQKSYTTLEGQRDAWVRAYTRMEGERNKARQERDHWKALYNLKEHN